MNNNTIPLFLDRPSDPAFLHPRDWITYARKLGKFKRWRPVEGCIITFDPRWFDSLKTQFKIHAKHELGIHIFQIGGQKLAAQNSAVGAAMAGSNLEILISLGLKKFITVGSAGSLQRNIGAGEICLPSKAIRDEGTSYHYQRPAKYAYPDQGLLKQLKKNMARGLTRYHTGPTWTTDALYRETIKKIRAYQKEGCLTVEMEAASLFSIAKFRRVALASLLGISDELHAVRWQPHFHTSAFKQVRLKLLEIAVEALLIQ